MDCASKVSGRTIKTASGLTCPVNRSISDESFSSIRACILDVCASSSALFFPAALTGEDGKMWISIFMSLVLPLLTMRKHGGLLFWVV